jgi:hypothetical protein
MLIIRDPLANEHMRHHRSELQSKFYLDMHNDY